MSHVKTKPAFAICEQQRCKSACTSAVWSTPLLFAAWIPLPNITKISRPQLVSVADQAGLSLTWLHTPKTGFLVTRLIYELAFVSPVCVPHTGLTLYSRCGFIIPGTQFFRRCKIYCFHSVYYMLIYVKCHIHSFSIGCIYFCIFSMLHCC